MNSLQKQVDDFMKEMGWQYFGDEEIIAKIKEEAKELEVEIINQNAANTELEYGDLLFAIMCLANKKKIDPDIALEKSIQKFKVRDKNRYPEGK